MTRRSPFSALLLLGFGLMLGAVLFGSPGTASTLVAAPIIALGFVFKVMFFMLLFGLVARAFGRNAARTHDSRSHRHGSPPWMSQGCRPGSDEKHGTSEAGHESRSEKFEDWHRMAHAREEVDDYAPPVED